MALAGFLAAPAEPRAQTGGSPLITIPPAKLSPPPAAPAIAATAAIVEPAARALLPTKLQILHDSAGSAIAMYGALTDKAASATGIVLAIFANSEAFDPTPALRLVLGDQDDRHAQALFTATVHGAPVTGIAVAALGDTGGDVTVFYGDADRFAAAFSRMRGALAQSDGVATVVLSPLHLGDGREIDIPPGWRVTAEGVGTVDLQGPAGESLSLGATMPVYAGDSVPGGSVLQAPCCDPGQAFTTLYPQIAAAEQRRGLPSRELTGIVESQPVAAGAGNGALILGNVQVGGADYAYLALAEAVAGFTDPWNFALSGILAPQPIFAAELPTLLQIWKSYRGAQPVFADALWQALRGMSATRQMLESTIAARETAEYNADVGWEPAIAAMATPSTGGQAEIDDALARSLADRLSSDTGRPWRIVPPAELR